MMIGSTCNQADFRRTLFEIGVPGGRTLFETERALGETDARS